MPRLVAEGEPVSKATAYYRAHKEHLNELSKERYRRRKLRETLPAKIEQLKALKEALEVELQNAERLLKECQPKLIRKAIYGQESELSSK